jgi:hypothetical protein
MLSSPMKYKSELKFNQILINNMIRQSQYLQQNIKIFNLPQNLNDTLSPMYR